MIVRGSPEFKREAWIEATATGRPIQGNKVPDLVGTKPIDGARLSVLAGPPKEPRLPSSRCEQPESDNR